MSKAKLEEERNRQAKRCADQGVFQGMPNYEDIHAAITFGYLEGWDARESASDISQEPVAETQELGHGEIQGILPKAFADKISWTDEEISRAKAETDRFRKILRLDKPALPETDEFPREILDTIDFDIDEVNSTFMTPFEGAEQLYALQKGLEIGAAVGARQAWSLRGEVGTNLKFANERLCRALEYEREKVAGLVEALKLILVQNEGFPEDFAERAPNIAAKALAQFGGPDDTRT